MFGLILGKIFSKIRIKGDLSPKRTFARHFATMMSAAFFSQALLLVTAPVLTRLYTPQDFGIFGLIMAYTSILSIIITGRYELAILLPEDSAKAMHVVILTCIIITLFSVVFLVLAATVQSIDLLSLPTAIRELGYWIYSVPVIAMFQSLYQTLYYWFNRQQEYVMMAKYRVWCSVITTGVAIILGGYPFIANGLIVSQLATYVVLVAGMGWKFRQIMIHDKVSIKWDSIVLQASRYKDFPRYLIVAHSLESLSAQLPVILLGQFYSTIIVGYFTLTQRVMAAPISFISKAAGDIIRERFSTSYRKHGECRNEYLTTIKGLTYVGLIPLFVFSVFGPALFAYVFGMQWEKAGHYAQALALMIFCQIVASPVSVMYMIAEKQQQELLLQIARITICFFALAIGHVLFNSDSISVLLYGIGMCLIYGFMIYQTNTWASTATCKQ